MPTCALSMLTLSSAAHPEIWMRATRCKLRPTFRRRPHPILRQCRPTPTNNLMRRQAMPDMTDAYQWQGRTMIGSDGEKLGKISEIYEDPATGKPEWATASSGMFGTK